MQYLTPIKNHLENEKLNFIKILCVFIEGIDFEEFEIDQINGRPKTDYRDLIKCLLIMSYHSWSYRRTNSDLELLKKDDVLNNIPKRATLNRYMQSPLITKILKKMIEISSLSFVDVEDCLMLDSTSFFNKLLMGGSKCKSHHRSSLFQVPSLSKTRKLHLAIAKNSKIITCARTSIGTVHDHNFSKELIETTIKSGFRIKTLLADAAYNSRENYCLCEDLGIKAFLDFKSNHKINRSQSKLRKEQITLYRKNPEVWHESYRFRVIVEGVMGAIKKKGRHYLRSRNEVSKDNEMLLKALWYNLCIIAKHIDNI